MTVQTTSSRVMPTVRGFDLLGGGIKSVQSGTVVFSGSSETSKNISISSVKYSKSIVLLSVESSTYNPNLVTFTGHLTSSTNLRIQRTTGYSGLSVEVTWTVIEFDSAYIVQTGEATIGSYEGVSVTVDISEVDLSKAFLIASNNLRTTSDSGPWFFYGKFNSSTQIYLQYGNQSVQSGTAGTKYLRWYVVQIP